jgi:hypothetical protein
MHPRKTHAQAFWSGPQTNGVDASLLTVEKKRADRFLKGGHDKVIEWSPIALVSCAAHESAVGTRRVKIETLNPRRQRHRSRSVETKEYIFLARVYAGVARLHFILMCRRAVANAKEIRMTLFSRKAAARLAATAGVVLALSAPCVAQSLDRQDGMGRDTQPLVQRLRSGG